LNQSDINLRNDKIVIIGLGYVGLTLALFINKLGFKVHAIEKNQVISSQLESGITDILDDGLQEILTKSSHEKMIIINQDFTNIIGRNIFIITVGTPIDPNNFLYNQIEEVKGLLVKYIQDGDLVILRSTLKIGTSEMLYTELRTLTGKNFSMATCPERTIEGNAIQELATLPQIISGINESSLDAADQFFSALGVETVKVENTSAAEFIKLATNTYRDLNFAFGNELALIADEYGVNAWKAIKQANHKYPRSNIQFPGLTGGPCLEKDPCILAISAHEKGQNATITLAARNLNLTLPEKSIHKVLMHPNFEDRVRENFLILGLAFKGNPPTKDVRGSMAFAIARIIKEKIPNANVTGWDPLITDCHEINLNANLDSALALADVIFVQNNNTDLVKLFKMKAKNNLKNGTIIFDFWNVFDHSDLPEQSHLISLGGGTL
jgi:UDP-N-acetyl-D-mannosaminuronic acid dehydrogenase